MGKNESLSRKEILSIGDNVKTINLIDISLFKWDTIYSFSPYTPKRDIYDIVGYKWDRISETVSEGMNQIVFVNDSKVVCYIYRYPQNNDYEFIFESGEHTEYASLIKQIRKD